jgi:hypothetical protein
MKRRIVKSFVIMEDGTIVHIRGDTALFSMKADLDGMPIDSYSATLSVRQYPDDTAYLLQKTFDQNTPCTINHDDTINLTYGTYWYDIQVVFTHENRQEYKTIGAFPYILKPDITTS